MSEYSLSKIKELQTKKNNIQEQMQSLAEPLILGIKEGKLSLPQYLPEEYYDLNKNMIDIEQKLWNLRSNNHDRVFYQELILRTQEHIDAIDVELEKFAKLEKLGIKIVSKDPCFDPVTTLQTQKQKLQEDINKYQQHLNKLEDY